MNSRVVNWLAVALIVAATCYMVGHIVVALSVPAKPVEAHTTVRIAS